MKNANQSVRRLKNDSQYNHMSEVDLLFTFQWIDKCIFASGRVDTQVDHHQRTNNKAMKPKTNYGQSLPGWVWVLSLTHPHTHTYCVDRMRLESFD